MPCKIRVSKVNLSDEEFTDFVLSLTTNPDTAIVVKEHKPKDHYHCYLEDCVTPPTIRERLSKICPTKGNDSYSVSTNHSDWKGYQGYLVKYEDTTILHCNYDIQKIKSYYESQSTKVKIRTEYTKIYNYVMGESPVDSPDPRTITKLVLKFYLEEQKIFNKAHIAQIVNTIYYQLNEDSERFISQVLEEADLQDTQADEVVHLRMENKQLRTHLKNYLRHVDPE